MREKFTGKEHDLDGADDGLGVKGIALDYFGFRYYDAEVGVWTCADPAMEFYHGYSYVGGEPVTTVDPLGLSTFEEFSSALDDIAPDDYDVKYTHELSEEGSDDPVDVQVSPLNPDDIFGEGGSGGGLGGLTNTGGDLASHEPGTPFVDPENTGGDGGELTEHNYTDEAMSGKGGEKGGVTSQDIEKNKARAKEKQRNYYSDAEPIPTENGGILPPGPQGLWGFFCDGISRGWDFRIGAKGSSRILNPSPKFGGTWGTEGVRWVYGAKLSLGPLTYSWNPGVNQTTGKFFSSHGLDIAMGKTDDGLKFSGGWRFGKQSYRVGFNASAGPVALEVRSPRVGYNEWRPH